MRQEHDGPTTYVWARIAGSPKFGLVDAYGKRRQYPAGSHDPENYRLHPHVAETVSEFLRTTGFDVMVNHAVPPIPHVFDPDMTIDVSPSLQRQGISLDDMVGEQKELE